MTNNKRYNVWKIKSISSMFSLQPGMSSLNSSMAMYSIFKKDKIPTTSTAFGFPHNFE